MWVSDTSKESKLCPTGGPCSHKWCNTHVPISVRAPLCRCLVVICVFITHHLSETYKIIHLYYAKSGSYFICRMPLVKRWSVFFNQVSRSKFKAIENFCVKFLSGAYFLSPWPNQAILYPKSACWKILCNHFKPSFKKSQGKNISVNFYSKVLPFHFDLQLLSYTCTLFIEC